MVVFDDSWVCPVVGCKVKDGAFRLRNMSICNMHDFGGKSPEVSFLAAVVVIVASL